MLNVRALTFVTSVGVAAAWPALAAEPDGFAVAPPSRSANFLGQRASDEARHIANWAVHSGDHKGRPFIVVDKREAMLFAFDIRGRLLRSTPVLLGIGGGDRFAPGVVNMDMAATQPWQRITPAGRFVAEVGDNLEGEEVLWVDYDAAIAIHRLAAKRTKQRRQERLASVTPTDNRITFGCINVPIRFYEDVIGRHFSQGGIVYVLPEQMTAKALFRSYDVTASGDLAVASHRRSSRVK